MTKINKILFSMQLTALLLVVFGFAIGFATFIENAHGTTASKTTVYNATWFEILLALIMINLTGSIFKHKMFRKEKFTIFIFHLAFIIMILGAAITRFISYEGIMSIREGKETNKIVTTSSYINIELQNNKETVYAEKKILLDAKGNKSFSKRVNFGDQTFKFKFVDFIPAATKQMMEDENGDLIISAMVFDGINRGNVFLQNGETTSIGGLIFSLNSNKSNNQIEITSEGENLYVKSPFPFKYMKMHDQQEILIPADTTIAFERGTLYNFKNIQLVINQVNTKAKLFFVRSENYVNSGLNDAVVIDVSSGEKNEKLTLLGKKGRIGDIETISFGDTKINVSYGAKYIQLPFSIKLIDFQLERYPGTNSPSSYASEVVVKDPNAKGDMPYRIYMNHILNYGGYRFFQSSYDTDELGTVLSVNHDALGTAVTYLSYILLAFGLIITLFNKNSRIQAVFRASSKLREQRKNLGKALTILLVFTGISVTAQTSYTPTPLEHAKKFGNLAVQDHTGRVEPINTLSSEVLRKISRKTSFNDLEPDQIFLDMMVNPEYWQNVKMIKVKNKDLQNFLGIDGKYISFAELVNFNTKDGYKLNAAVKEANQKEPRARSKFDKDVLHVDERVNICYYVFIGSFFNVFPIVDDVNNTWISPDQFSNKLNYKDSALIYPLLKNYFDAVLSAKESGNWEQANTQLKNIVSFQKTYGAQIYPSDSKLKLEIKYNEINIFVMLERYYVLVGLVLLLLSFLSILVPKIPMKWPFRLLTFIVGILFLANTAGLIARWYISGHAPWSNAYESMIFIGWTTILAGLLFVNKSKIALTASTLMATLILSVAHMNWLDPEITPLVPVLKSYWLIIHVATITSSYAFLGIGAIVAFFSLILMIMRNKKNQQSLNLAISEFTHVIEPTLQIGLILLTIGTFLGGVWANESWGRYWGWDPKETWSLVTIVVYSFILHARFVPGIRGEYAFNLMSLVGFSSVLMTYFGVNYYLAGMHSYAKGEASALPSFAYYTIGIIIVVAILAFIRSKVFEKKN